MNHLQTAEPVAIDDERLTAAADHRETRPSVGQSVAFHARPFERRQGRATFPALVLARDEHGGLNLLVFFDADDHVSLRGVPPFSDADGFGWSLPGAAGPGNDELIRRIGDAVFGENAMPDESLIDTLLLMGEEIRRLQQKVAELEDYVGEVRDPKRSRAAARAANEKARKGR